MRCKVCGENFKDIYAHVLDGTSWNKRHLEYGREVEQGNYHDVCFCGSYISMIPSGAESYEIRCQNCDFIWDED